jgi:hypothetical protein
MITQRRMRCALTANDYGAAVARCAMRHTCTAGSADAMCKAARLCRRHSIQLRELASINGTLRDTDFCHICGESVIDPTAAQTVA